PFAVPSLSAALLLGLREQMGGHPDHVQIERVVDPTLSDGSDNHDALLLHDVVPGGTGYLAELATPERLRELLVLAWGTVRDCECQHEERLACHRCLLPFVHGSAVRTVARASAERHLRALLGLAADAETADGVVWAVTDVPPATDPESHLEQRFRKVLVERLRTLGASVTEVPGVWGNTVRFTVPSSTRQWTLTPQVNLENSKPDFVLEATGSPLPAVAVFVDGHRFHATPAHNRLADDAEKRAILRATGRVVLGISARDVEAAEAGETASPPWFQPEFVGQLLTVPAFMTAPGAYADLAKGAIDWLIDWVDRPEPEERRVVARAVPLFLQKGAQILAVSADVTLAQVAADTLLGRAPDAGPRQVAVWRSGALAVGIEARGPVIDVAVVLDDRAPSLDDSHRVAWREGLRLSNALALRDWPTVVTTLSLVEQQGASSTVVVPPEGDPTVEVADPGWAPEWADAHRAARPGIERELIAALAARGGLRAPAIGQEGPDGIPMDLSWPDQRVVVVVPEMPEDDRRDLMDAGWLLVDPDPETIVAVLAGAGSGSNAVEG
ncbi:MAG TPA: DUF1998 domain-containing protein, partial [Pengzhenrongella sp.]